jgi:hypothetical protein
MRSVLAWNGFNTEIGGVDNVNASRFLLGRRSAGLLRIPYVFAGSQCLQGLECSSSPTSGTVFSLVKGQFSFFLLTKLDFIEVLRVEMLHASGDARCTRGRPDALDRDQSPRDVAGGGCA